MENKEHRSSLERELRGYMLGELTELEQQRYEERLLSEDERFREVEELTDLVQDELVQDYLTGELSNGERRAFERYQFVCPMIQEMRLVQEALRGYPRPKFHQSTWAERLKRWFRPDLNPAPALAMTLTLVLIAGGGWSVYKFGQLNRELDQTSSRSAMLDSTVETLRRELEEERQRRSTLSQELAAAKSSPERLEQPVKASPPRGIVSFVLLPGLQRSSGGATRVSLPSGQNILELRLDIGVDEYVSYQAAVFNSGSDLIVEQQHLSAVHVGEKVYVVIELPRPLLREDDYQITLRGVDANRNVEMIDRYSFRLTLR